MELRPLRPGDPRDVAGYRLLGGLGDGGQGSVFLGRDADGRHAAVKVLHPRLLSDRRATRRFLRESATAAKVAGLRTAVVYGSGLAEGRPYIVSEFIDGPSLHELVLDAGPLAGGELERLAVGTLTALTAIHKAGIVHRDFKPSNVLMAHDGPRVIDFGIARDLDASTTASSVVGTPGYMSPEQISGERATAASDVFSWAATMAYAATGRPLFGRDSIPAVMHRILHADPDLSEVPEDLRPVLRACLAKDPSARPSADDVLTRLHTRTAPQPEAEPRRSPRPGHGEEPWREAGRRRGLRVTPRGWAAAGVGGLVVAGVVAGAMWRGTGLPETTAPATDYGVALGPAFGPEDGADVAALAIGHDKGAPVVAYADSANGSIQVWDPRTGELVDRLDGAATTPVRSLALVPVGGRQTVIWVTADGYVRRWRVGDARQGPWNKPCATETLVAPGQWHRQPALVVGCADGGVKVLDLATNRVSDLRRVLGPVTALTWDEASSRALVGTRDGVVGAPPGVLGEGEVRAVAALGDGHAAVTTGSTTAVYDLATGSYVRGFSTGTSDVAVTAAGGRRMIVVGGDGVTVWNADGGDRLGTPVAPGRKVTELAVGDGLLVAALKGRLRAWSLAATT